MDRRLAEFREQILAALDPTGVRRKKTETGRRRVGANPVNRPIPVSSPQNSEPILSPADMREREWVNAMVRGERRKLRKQRNPPKPHSSIGPPSIGGKGEER